MKNRRLLLILIMIGTAMACSFTQVASDIEFELSATALRLTDTANAPYFAQTATVVAVTYAHYYQELTRLAVEIPATQTALVPSRTAIALTRQPELSESGTLHPIEITATAVMNKTPVLPTADTWALTATQIVAEITQTAIVPSTQTASAATPGYNMTETADATLVLPRCDSYIPERSTFLGELESRMNSALFEQNMPAGVTIEPPLFNRTMHPYCQSHSSKHLSTGIIIQMQNDGIEPEQISREVEQILALFSEQFQPVPDYGFRPRFSIIFIQRKTLCQGNPPCGGYNIFAAIDTDYQNALDAYQEGLRDADLIEALGGWIPDWVHW